MKTNATQRSLKVLRENGWTVHIVEKFIKHPNMAFGKRIDVFGFGDLLAMRPDTYGEKCDRCNGAGEIKINVHGTGVFGIQHACEKCKGMGRILIGPRAIALVQCCPGASHAEHKDKILAIPEFCTWKAAGGHVFLQSWSFKGPRGAKKHWTMREEEL